MKSKIYYFEGPDHAGKTSLIDSLATPGSDLRFSNGVYPSPDDAYNAFIDQYLEASEFLISTFGDNSVFIDRGPISEVIYGSVLRDNQMRNAQFFNCMDRLREIGATIILCMPPYEVCLAGWKSRLDEELVQKELQYEEIYGRYKRMPSLIEDTGVKLVIYDYTQTTEYTNADS